MDKINVTEDGCVVDKVYVVDLENDAQADRIIKAFNCKTRRDIFRLLAKENLSIWNIAQKLNVPLSTISEHVKVLASSGLVTVQNKNMEKGKEKIVIRQYEKVEIPILSLNENARERKKYTVQIPIGGYTGFKIKKYCGIVSEEGYIGAARDDPDVFYDPLRFKAQLIWFDEGYLEYTVPVKGINFKDILSLSFSAEFCSEAPGYNEDWKSDISFSVNGKEVCVYTCPGDFGARRGLFTPKWWDEGTQYGLMKKVEITTDGTYLDSKFVSGVTLSDLELGKEEVIRLRIGVDGKAKNKGGINLFGSKFGDYRQHIYLSVAYREAK